MLRCGERISRVLHKMFLNKLILFATGAMLIAGISALINGKDARIAQFPYYAYLKIQIAEGRDSFWSFFIPSLIVIFR